MDFFLQLAPLTAVILKALLVVIGLMAIAAYAVLAERKVSAWIQGRVGPNRTTIPILGSIPVIGLALTRIGFFQPAADGLKFLFKEDVVPGHVNRLYFMLAPAIALVPALVIVSVIPFGQYYDPAAGVLRPIVIADIDLGILFLLAVSSLGVYSLILAGWSSNSKYPFLGGIRASAQMISYELAMGLSLLPVFLWINRPGVDAGLNLSQVVMAQEGAWLILIMPGSAFIFLASLFAETNRLPFDMPESETELVGGFHTEYSSFKFGFFFVAEYAHMIIGSAVLTLLFFGGWHPLPWLTLEEIGLAGGLLGAVASISIFLGKTFLVLFFFIWVRWTLPRFRYDQVMKLGWQRLLPLAIANLVFYVLLLACIDSP